MKYLIEKCESKEDFDNNCFQPSDGGQYDAKRALSILENSNGGVMIPANKKGGYIVNYNREDNDWIRKKLKIR